MKRTHTSFVAGLAICVVAIILVIYKTEVDRKNRDDSPSTVNCDDASSAERRQEREGAMPRKTRRQRSARENIDVLSGLGYVLAADDIGDHRAKGNVQIISPEGAILRSDSVSISSDGDNIFLVGNIKVELISDGQLSTLEYKGTDSFAKIALDGGAVSFEGKGNFAFKPNKKKETEQDAALKSDPRAG